jgi:hypothetical protein
VILPLTDVLKPEGLVVPKLKKLDSQLTPIKEPPMIHALEEEKYSPIYERRPFESIFAKAKHISTSFTDTREYCQSAKKKLKRK